MKFTNKSGLPDALLKAIQNDPYDMGDSDFTVTGLIKPVRIAKLEKLHKDEIEQDVEQSLYRLYGQIAHSILERANHSDLAEKRFFATYEVDGKEYKVSAQIDTLSIDDGVLSDFKFTTSYGFKTDSEPKSDWVAQMNVQLELLRRNGLDANELQIVGLLRDWQIKSAKEDPAYPQKPIAIQEINIWPREQTDSFIKMRIKDHVTEDLPLCDPSERWAKPNVWAVMKHGKTRAINGGIQLSEESAKKVSTNNPGTYIQFRQGEDVRCLNYCNVNKFCDYFKSKNKEQ